MKTLTNRQLVKEFNKFLRENNCASKFYVNKVKKKRKGASIMLIRANPITWIEEAFIWGKTPEGHLYWYNKDFKWKHKLKKIGYKS